MIGWASLRLHQVVHPYVLHIIRIERKTENVVPPNAQGFEVQRHGQRAKPLSLFIEYVPSRHLITRAVVLLHPNVASADREREPSYQPQSVGFVPLDRRADIVLAR
jgi:hypothetical protein